MMKKSQKETFLILQSFRSGTNYSDLKEEEETKIHCYSLKEILIEKITALMGRTIPRDLYDFDFLIEKEGIALKDVYIEFINKATSKGHNPKELINKITLKKKTFKRDWQSSLAKQMISEDLPNFDSLWRRALGNFKGLIKLIEK